MWQVLQCNEEAEVNQSLGQLWLKLEDDDVLLLLEDGLVKSLEELVTIGAGCRLTRTTEVEEKEQVDTIKPRYTGPKSNGNPPITKAKHKSLQVISF